MKATIFVKNESKELASFKVTDGNAVYEMAFTEAADIPYYFTADDVKFIQLPSGDAITNPSDLNTLLRTCTVCEAEVYDAYGETETAEIESISFLLENGESVHLFEGQFSTFIHLNIPVFGRISKNIYDSIAQFVRTQDHIENLQNALECNMVFSEHKNVKADLEIALSDDSERSVIAEEWAKIEEYTGEDEIKIINQIISERGGMAWYKVYSYDMCQRVLLMKEKGDTYAENVREHMNGADMLLKEGDIVLIDEDGDTCDLFYATDMEFDGMETL